MISLELQPHDHFIYQLGTLREEFMCTVSGRLMNLKVKFPEQAERKYLVRQDEIRAADQNGEKEYGMRTFVPPSMTDINEYWREMATKYFAR
jgi:DNA-directed RNA polymerase